MANKVIKFFSYVVKEDITGIQALLGRKKLLYEDAVLQDFELCVQKVKQVSDILPKNSPINISPRKLLLKTYKPDYELYCIRSCAKATVLGKIWYISQEEYAYWREYELIEYGLSEDIVAKVITENGDIVTVMTYGLIKNAKNISKIIDADYIRENISTKKKLQHKRNIRLEYLSRKRLKQS
jgi:hypothetical protein